MRAVDFLTVVGCFVIVVGAGACSEAPTDSEVSSTPTASASDGGAVGIASAMERSERIGACMLDRGLAITVFDDGSYGYDNRVVSPELFEQTRGQCEQELMAAGEIGAPPGQDPEYLAAVFQDLVAQAQCLREHGYPVDEEPSQQAWIDSKGAVWNPFDAVYETGQDIDQAEKACA